MGGTRWRERTVRAFTNPYETAIKLSTSGESAVGPRLHRTLRFKWASVLAEENERRDNGDWRVDNGRQSTNERWTYRNSAGRTYYISCGGVAVYEHIKQSSRRRVRFTTRPSDSGTVVLTGHGKSVRESLTGRWWSVRHVQVHQGDSNLKIFVLENLKSIWIALLVKVDATLCNVAVHLLSTFILKISLFKILRNPQSFPAPINTINTTMVCW